MNRYFGNWQGEQDLRGDFELNSNELDNAVVIVAGYDTEQYEGYAMVVFRKDGKLYEVHGSHCSCNGLENQWKPEETTYEAILHRLDKNEYYMVDHIGEAFAEALRKGLVDEMFDREVLEN